jgi:hypothetical protein
MAAAPCAWAAENSQEFTSKKFRFRHEEFAGFAGRRCWGRHDCVFRNLREADIVGAAHEKAIASRRPEDFAEYRRLLALYRIPPDEGDVAEGMPASPRRKP